MRRYALTKGVHILVRDITYMVNKICCAYFSNMVRFMIYNKKKPCGIDLSASAEQFDLLKERIAVGASFSKGFFAVLLSLFG